MLALVHLMNCKLLQYLYKKDSNVIKLIPCNSFRIPSVLKACDRVCRETNRKFNLLSENLSHCIRAFIRVFSL